MQPSTLMPVAQWHTDAGARYSCRRAHSHGRGFLTDLGGSWARYRLEQRAAIQDLGCSRQAPARFAPADLTTKRRSTAQAIHAHGTARATAPLEASVSVMRACATALRWLRRAACRCGADSTRASYIVWAGGRIGHTPHDATALQRLPPQPALSAPPWLRAALRCRPATVMAKMRGAGDCAAGCTQASSSCHARPDAGCCAVFGVAGTPLARALA